MARKSNNKATANVINMATVTPFNPEEMLARTVMGNTYELWGKRIAAVPTALMRLDMSYQRQLSANISKLVREWDNAECKFLLVSYRDGVFYVLDGQHRKAAAEIKGISELPCEILTGLTREEEALIFARQNRNVKKLYPFDTYKANLACGNKDIPEVWTDMEINRICSAHGVEVKKIGRVQTNPKMLRSITGTREIVRCNGSTCFEWVIKMITSSNWDKCEVSYGRDIIRMLKNFYIDNVGNLPKAEEKLVKIMNEKTPMELITKAKGDFDTDTYKISTALDLCLKSMM